jgi:hypothetical protein
LMKSIHLKVRNLWIPIFAVSREINLNNSGIKISREKFDYDGKALYENQLNISDISPNVYTFQCQGSGFTEKISFRAKGR